MSKLFIIKCEKSKDILTSVNEVLKICHNYNLGVFFDTDYYEPVFQHMNRENTLLISIADSAEYNNCDMLLLPDDCYINGKSNKRPFIERAAFIQKMVQSIFENAYSVEVFIGDSGTQLCEYHHQFTNIYGLIPVLMQMNSSHAPDLHITLTRF